MHTFSFLKNSLVFVTSAVDSS